MALDGVWADTVAVGRPAAFAVAVSCALGPGVGGSVGEEQSGEHWAGMLEGKWWLSELWVLLWLPS